MCKKYTNVYECKWCVTSVGDIRTYAWYLFFTFSGLFLKSRWFWFSAFSDFEFRIHFFVMVSASESLKHFFKYNHSTCIWFFRNGWCSTMFPVSKIQINLRLNFSQSYYQVIRKCLDIFIDHGTGYRDTKIRPSFFFIYT